MKRLLMVFAAVMVLTFASGAFTSVLAAETDETTVSSEEDTTKTKALAAAAVVGVVAADMALNLPDYRSRERAFQLLTQVAGRAGRGQQSGRVIIQTYLPNDPVIGFAARQDYRAFFESEFRRRRNGLYPPFTLLARLLIEGGREEAVIRAADELEEKVQKLVNAHPDWQRKLVIILKDTPSVKFLKAKYRRHIVIKALVSSETDAFFGALTELAAEGTESAEVYFEVNPNTMM